MEKTNVKQSELGSAIYAARRAADVIFVLQKKEQLDHATLVGQLNETLELYGERSKVTAADFDELRSVTRKLLKVFTTPDVIVVASILNTILSEYAHPPRLSSHGNSKWHIHVDSDDNASWSEWFAASSALALATLLAEKQRNPGGICASLDCGRPFIDLGKGGGRTYCSPRCATRERVAAYRKRSN